MIATSGTISKERLATSDGIEIISVRVFKDWKFQGGKMKRGLFMLLILLLIIFSVACSSSVEPDAGKAVNTEEVVESEAAEEVKDVEKERETEQLAVEPKEPEGAEERKAQGLSYFDGEILETEKLKVKITDKKVLQPGDQGNEWGEKPLFVIWAEVTNKVGVELDIDAVNTIRFVFKAIQDNKEDYINTLTGIYLSDVPDSAYKTIKKDGTVEAFFGYELSDEVTPITIVAIDYKGTGEEIGSYDYKLD